MPTIRELRERKGWSQRQLGKELGVTSQAVFYWERGINTPNTRHLRALALLFGVSMDEIDFVGPKEQRDAPDTP